MTSRTLTQWVIQFHVTSLIGVRAALGGHTSSLSLASLMPIPSAAQMRDQVQFMVGGAPVTPEFAEEMGADAYGGNAMECVDVAKKLASVT